MNRIAEAFVRAKRAGRGAFIPFIVAGHPDLETTGRIISELTRSGADIIEVGVPFSDPVADGEVIQSASQRALLGGTTLSGVLNCVADAKKRVDVPIVLFSYFNPLLRFGPERLAARARTAGVDAILVTDLIPEEPEARSWERILMSEELAPIYLVAPTTSEPRLRLIAEKTRGFLYAVSRAGVTGARSEMAADARKLVQRIRQVSDVPVAVGFGISTAEQVREVWGYADGAVVGSAIVQKIEQASDGANVVHQVGEFARALLGTGNFAGGC